MINEREKQTDGGNVKETPETGVSVEEAKKPKKKTVSRTTKPPEPLAAGLKRVRMLKTGSIKVVGERTASALVSKKRAEIVV